MNFEKARQVFTEEMGLILNIIAHEMRKDIASSEEAVIRHERFGRVNEAIGEYRLAARYSRIAEAAELLTQERIERRAEVFARGCQGKGRK